MSAGTFGGGGGGGTPSQVSSSHLPRTTGEVRVAYDVTLRMLACPRQPCPRIVRQRHPPELAAGDSSDTVMLGEPIVEKGVVRGEQIRERAVLTHLAGEKERGLLTEGLTKAVELGKLRRVRFHGREILQVQPVAEEAGQEGIRLAVGEHAPHLLLQPCRITQTAVCHHRVQRGVRLGVPEELRQPRGDLPVAERFRQPRRPVGLIGAVDRGFDGSAERFGGGAGGPGSPAGGCRPVRSRRTTFSQTST